MSATKTCRTCDGFGIVEGVGKQWEADNGIRIRECRDCGIVWDDGDTDECRDWGRPVTTHYPRSEFHGAEALYWYHAAYLEAARSNRREALIIGVTAGLAVGILAGLSIASTIVIGW